MDRRPLDILELVAIAVSLIAALLVVRGAGSHGEAIARDELLGACAIAAAMAALVVARRVRRDRRGRP